MSKTVVLISLLLALGCAGRATDENPAPAAPATATQSDGFTYSHSISNIGPGVCIESTRPDIVQLRGATCTPDGSVCFDMGESTADVYEKAEAEHAPFGSASFVAMHDPCPFTE